MGETYQISLGYFDGVFAVPNLVADRLRFADAKALKPLLYLLSRSGTRVSVEDLARATNLSTGEVRDGLDYWVGEGLLRVESGEYAPESGPADGVPGRIQAGAPAAERPDEAVPAGSGAAETFSGRPEPGTPEPGSRGGEGIRSGESGVRPEAASRSAQLSSRPAKLAPGEAAARIEGDPALKFMVEKSEQLLGRPLNTSDLSTLIALVDWAGLSPDLVLMLVGHCRDLGKTNLRYIERVGADWADRGIDTHEKAETFIRKQTEEQEREREVVTAFGISNRSLTSKEKGYVAQWYGDFGFDLRMIRLAYERAVDRTGKVSFPYIHRILQSWHEKGFRDPKDAAGEASAVGQPRGKQQTAQSTMDYELAEQMLYEGFFPAPEGGAK